MERAELENERVNKREHAGSLGAIARREARSKARFLYLRSIICFAEYREYRTSRYWLLKILGVSRCNAFLYERAKLNVAIIQRFAHVPIRVRS